MKILLNILSWFIVGLFTGLLMIADDIRGKDFKESYFDADFFKVVALVISFGYASPLIYLVIKLCDKFNELCDRLDGEEFQKKFGMFIYKLVNIGYRHKQGDLIYDTIPDSEERDGL